MKPTRRTFRLSFVQLFALLLMLNICPYRSNAQGANNVTTAYPVVTTYQVCELPNSFDTLYYYSEFGVELDDATEHMKVYDYVLPRNLTGKIKLQVKGGKGGDSKIDCGVELYGDGGKGALVTGWATIGAGGIPRGSTIRYVLGEAGLDSYDESTGAEYHRGGSGGGASAILYKAPDSTNWTVLMIAGGGGGGYVTCFPWDEFGVAALYRLDRTGGPGGLSQSALGNGGAAFYTWDNSDHNIYYVSCGGYKFTAHEFWFDGDGIATSGTVTTNDAQNFCSKISGGGGYTSEGHAPCGEYSGGMPGSVWTQASLPLVYGANFGGGCVTYSNMRRGGRGFCGGGAAFSQSTWYFGSRHDWWAGCGGGGGATGGAGAIGSPNGVGNEGSKPAEGGSSWVNKQYVSDFSFAANNTIENGYGWFYFIPDTSTIQPNLSINIGEPIPFCSGTNVTMVATLSASAGSLLDGIVNPVFTWKINGQVIGTGTNVGYNVFTNQPDSPAVYTFNTIPVVYKPADVVTCSVSGTDLNMCGRPISRTASFVIPTDEGMAGSSVAVVDSPANALCQAYYDSYANKSYGNASLHAVAALYYNLDRLPVVPYKPYYRWYINGDRVSAHYTVVDTLAILPVISVADGDSAWCEVYSNHCSFPNKSNVIHFTVSGVPGTGGTITGPLHPGPNTTNTYILNGALHTVSYNWAVTGDADSIVNNHGDTLSFHIGTGNAHIIGYPQGACGGGDTLQLDVSPSNRIPDCQNSSPLVVTPAIHCSGQEVTINAPYDTAAGHNNFDWYEWSTGANTRSITVTDDGTYYAYLNGCKSESVVVTGIAVVQPSIGISIVPTSNDAVRNYWCRQDGHRSITVSSSENLSSFSNVEYQWFSNGIRISAGLNTNYPDHLDLDLNTLFYHSNDTITCKAICTAACGTATTFSNSILLPAINDPAVVSINITPSATTVCSGQVIDFASSVQHGGTSPDYQWIVDDGSPVYGDTAYSVSFTNYTGSPQVHTIYAKVSVNPGGSVDCLSGLPLAQSATISVTVNPQPAISVTANNVSGCAGSAITLSGLPAGGTFNQPNPYFGPSSTYNYYYVDANGCSVTSAPATITVTNLPLVSATVSPNDTACQNEEVTFTGSGANTYSWTKGVIDGEPYRVDSTDTFTVTGYGSGGCNSERVFIKLSAGLSHSLGIKSDGTLWAWGDNTYGNLGDSTTSSRSTPVQIGTGNNWVNISAGAYHSLGIKSDGTLWAWGKNNYGTLGNGTNLNSNIPVQVGTETNWVSIAAGNEFSLGVRSDGTLWAWGFNTYGQLGVNGNTNTNLPMRVDASFNWASVAAGVYHSVALKSDGTLWTWGTNFYGELGNTYTASNIPYRVGVANDWISIGAGAFTTMGIKSNGTLWTWGRNYEGQLGDGTTTSRYEPMQVGTGTNWVSVGAGWYYAIGLQNDGTLWSWGYNADGELGNGSFTLPVLSPAQVGGETNWAAIAAGGYHSFGIKSYGASLAWGKNGSSELGDGTTLYRAVPVTPVIPPSTATVVVTVKPSPEITVNASPSFETCSGYAITLTATGSDHITWTGGITNGVPFIPAGTGLFRVTGTSANGCASDVEKTITVDTTEVWYLDADHDGHYVSSMVKCGWPGEGYVLEQGIAGDCDDSDSTKWQSALLYVDADGDGYTVGPPTLVCYGDTIPAGLTATSLGTDCDDADPSPTVTITPGGSTTIYAGQSVVLTSSPGISYLWSTDATTQSITASSVGDYTVTVIDEAGCSSTSAVTTVSYGSPLAIKWIKLNGSLNSSNNAVLNWEVAEQNIAGFHVQKSSDGINFTTIGSLNSKGNGTNSYTYTDAATDNENIFYRIEEIDKDGKSNFSSIVSIKSTKTSTITIYPNPTGGRLTVLVPNSLLGTNAILSDVPGRTLSIIKLNNTSTIINLGNVASDVYFLKFADGNVKEVIRQ